MKKEFVLTLFFMGAAFVLFFLTVADLVLFLMKTACDRLSYYCYVTAHPLASKKYYFETYLTGF